MDLVLCRRVTLSIIQVLTHLRYVHLTCSRTLVSSQRQLRSSTSSLDWALGLLSGLFLCGLHTMCVAGMFLQEG
jgi:hypothetical protein